MRRRRKKFSFQHCRVAQRNFFFVRTFARPARSYDRTCLFISVWQHKSTYGGIEENAANEN